MLDAAGDDGKTGWALASSSQCPGDVIVILADDSCDDGRDSSTKPAKFDWFNGLLLSPATITSVSEPVSESESPAS